VPTINPVTVQLPPPQPRKRGLFVDAALQLGSDAFTANGRNRLGNGIQHNPWGCAPLIAGGLDCSADFLLNGDGPAYESLRSSNLNEENINTGKSTAIRDYDAVVEHPAFKVVDGLECSTLSFPDDNQYGASMTNRLRNRMRTQMSAMLTAELVSGWASGGPSLSSEADVLTEAFDMDEAAVSIEEWLAGQLHGNTGVVYIPPQVLHRAVSADWVQVVGNSLETVSGHVVISDAGHLGDVGPTDPGVPGVRHDAAGRPFQRHAGARVESPAASRRGICTARFRSVRRRWASA